MCQSGCERLMVEQDVVLYVLKLFWSPKQRAVNETFRFASLSAVLHKGGGQICPRMGRPARLFIDASQFCTGSDASLVEQQACVRGFSDTQVLEG